MFTGCNLAHGVKVYRTHHGQRMNAENVRSDLSGVCYQHAEPTVSASADVEVYDDLLVNHLTLHGHREEANDGGVTWEA
jgi:hypothetical protein